MDKIDVLLILRTYTVALGRCVRALRAAGVGKGDRVSGVMTNSQEAIVCMLGVTAVGAVWRYADHPKYLRLLRSWIKDTAELSVCNVNKNTFPI